MALKETPFSCPHSFVGLGIHHILFFPSFAFICIKTGQDLRIFLVCGWVGVSLEFWSFSLVYW